MQNSLSSANTTGDPLVAGAVIFVGVLLSGTLLHISGALEFEVVSKGRKNDALVKEIQELRKAFQKKRGRLGTFLHLTAPIQSLHSGFWIA